MWCAIKAVARRHFGRRGTFLAAFGMIYMAYGASVLTTEVRFAELGPVLAPVFAHQQWGLMWIAAGVAAVTASMWRRWVRGEQIGYSSLLLPPLIWALLHTLSATMWIVTGGVYGDPRAWAAAVIWPAVVVAVLVVSGWPEVPDDNADC